MATLTVPQNSHGYILTFTVTNSAGTAYDLTGYTVKFKVWKINNPLTRLVDGTCTFTEAQGNLGICKYTVANGDFDIAGKFLGELELTYTNVEESTENFNVVVKESG